MNWKTLALGLSLFAMAESQVLREFALGQRNGVERTRWTYQSKNLEVDGILFVPPTPRGTKRPVVIFNHDGSSGISRQHELSCIRLAKAGYVVFAPSYRGEDGSQGMIEIAKGEVDDVSAAIELMRTVPQADAQRIALAGASHGALISLLASARHPEIKALVVAYGVMDIYRWWDYLKAHNKVGRDEITRRTYGDGPEHRPKSFAIRNGLSVVDKVPCPVLVLQGKKDDIVPPEQALYLGDALKKAGKSCQVELYPDCLHGFLVYATYLDSSEVTPEERAQTEESWKTLLSFLKENLLSTKQ